MKRALRAVWHWRKDIVSRIRWPQPTEEAATLNARQAATSRPPSHGSRDGFRASAGGSCMMATTLLGAPQDAAVCPAGPWFGVLSGPAGTRDHTSSPSAAPSTRNIAHLTTAT